MCSRWMALVLTLLALGQLPTCCLAIAQLDEEFIWGYRDDSSQRICHAESVIVPPTWEAFFSFFRPVTRLVTFTPPNTNQAVRYIRVWTDAPWHRFRAELVHGGVGTKAPASTIIRLHRHWLLFANIVVYCSIPTA
ncbi:uncharacterized protein LOC118461632 [Anopheles albimanus]|uniref:Uncharacterized protein n=1 Tax=Anopheles albimanus TaxID=7167 RepID=A0A182FX69_ANOAL|nr:uncharacterized protein LOC118461632 [Anopheles albimanus]